VKIGGMKTQSAMGRIDHSSMAAWLAWRRYLTTVRAADSETYAVVEESAWTRLRDELAAAGRPLTEDVPLRVLA
jgi:hypothetical protein